jgi:mRNA interferase HicA
MKRAKLIKHLHGYGCRPEREGGRHTIYCDAAGRRKSAVPRHREIKTNTMRQICEDLGVPPPRGK